MAGSPISLVRVVTTLLMIIIFSLSFLPSKSGETTSNEKGEGSCGEVLMQQREKILGSRPPACVNKCLNCRPCMSILVIPPHRTRITGGTTSSTSKKYYSSRGDDDTYYLLSWKCKCGNKLFQP